MPERKLSLRRDVYRPGRGRKVSTTTALPEESVVTMRLESEPAVGLKKIVPPAWPPPD